MRYITTQPSLTQDQRLQPRAKCRTPQGGEPSYEAGVAGGDAAHRRHARRRAPASGTARTAAGSIASTRPTTRRRVQQECELRRRRSWCASRRSGQPADELDGHAELSTTRTGTRNDVAELLAAVLRSRQRPLSSARNPTQRHDAGHLLPAGAQDRGRLRRGQLDLEHLRTTTARRRPATTARSTTSASTRRSVPAHGSIGVATVLPTATFPLLDGTGLHLPAGAIQLPLAGIGRQRPAEHHPGNPPAVGGSARPAHVDHGPVLLVEPADLPRADPRPDASISLLGLLCGRRHPAPADGTTSSRSRQPRQQPDGMRPVPRHLRSATIPNDSYFLHTHAKDKQCAVTARRPTRSRTQCKATVGVRFSQTKYSFDTLTGGPQLFGADSG